MRSLPALAFALLGLPAWACCPAPPPGVEVKIADQEVLIVYDEAQQREHFVRSATFTGQSKGFGFLVPTPTRPELGVASTRVFETLRRQIAPRVEYETSYYPVPGCFCLMPLGGVKSAPTAVGGEGAAHVEVLERQMVAGYDVAVLAANDADALLGWLKSNGFDARPSLKEWSKPYVTQGWIITAFSYQGVPADEQVTAKTVRLSFDTDRPLFPYRVPTDNLAPPGKGNMLRLFYVGSGKVTGALGAKGTAWAGSTKYSKPTAGLDWMLDDAVPKDALAGKQLWLTAFEDTTWPGGTEDLFFTQADGVEIEPPPVIVKRSEPMLIPMEPFLVVGAILGVVWWRKRKRKQPADGA